MTLHNFAQSLAAAEAPEVEQFLEANYRALFPHMVGSTKNSRNNLGQHLGVDRVLLLDNGNIIRCEEKIRARDYGDFLFEWRHYYEGGIVKPGWAEKDLICDFFIYAVPSTNTFWCFPWAQLKAAWKANQSRWSSEGTRRTAKNKNYETFSYAVPLVELKRALLEQVFFRNPA